MVTGDYRELFATAAAAAGALTGLLFVAMSVTSQRALVSGPPIIRQIRASAALLAFTNTLAISLFGLVPGTNIGYPAIVVAVIGIMFTAAAMRSILASHASPAVIRNQIELIVILVLVCVTELVAGVIVLANPASTSSVQIIGYAVVTSTLVGIGRAWEFIGERETGILASLGILAGRPGTADDAGRPATERPTDPAGAGNPAEANDQPGQPGQPG